MKKLRNIVLAGAMATTLTACGGGGGSGAVGTVTDFVTEDLSNLAGSESIINSYSSILFFFVSISRFSNKFLSYFNSNFFGFFNSTKNFC